MTGINTYRENRRGGESAKDFYVEPRASAQHSALLRHSALLLLSSRAIIVVITSAEPGPPTRVRFARDGLGSARDLLLASCSQASPQRHNSANSCAQMCVRQVRE